MIFLSLVDKCPFCNNTLEVVLNGKNVINESPHNKLHSIKYPVEPSQYSFDNELYSLTYYFELEDNELLYWSAFRPNEDDIKVFSINISDNKLTSYGSIQHIQRILLEYNMCLLKKCNNRDCLRSGFKYRYQSSNLILGVLTGKIYPITLNVEAIMVVINDNKFSLISSIDSPNTYLLDNKEIVATLPKLNLYKILDKNYLIKKIKTYILFS